MDDAYSFEQALSQEPFGIQHVPSVHSSVSLIKPHTFFVYDDYDWEGFKVEGQAVLKLTQGFFTFVSEDDLEKLNGTSVCANVWKTPTGEIDRVYAVLRHPKLNKRVYLHRYLLGVKNRFDIVDHVNKWPLDNQSGKNLWDTSWSLNNSNRIYTRENDLPRGVKREGSRFRGQIWFQGKGYFSPVVGTIEEASGWYKAKYEEFHGKAVVAGKKPSLTYPVFPPRKDVEDDIPF